MDTIDSDPISIKEAMHRYGISSATTWAEWLQKAGIQSFKQGRNRYIYTYQLAALDAIARERDRTINTSSPESIETVLTEHFQHFQEPKVLEVSEAVTVITSLTEIIQGVVQSRLPTIDPDENLIRLERYAKNGWRITSIELAPLIGLKSMPKSPYKKSGFYFERTGREWKISKLEE